MSVRAAGGRAGARVVDVGHQRVGRGADHRLQVDAGVRQRGDGQRPLPAQSGSQPRAGEPRHWTQRDTVETMSDISALWLGTDSATWDFQVISKNNFSS